MSLSFNSSLKNQRRVLQREEREEREMKEGRAHKPVHMTSREVFSDIDIEDGNKVTVLLIREKIKYGDLEGEKKRKRQKNTDWLQ